MGKRCLAVAQGWFRGKDFEIKVSDVGAGLRNMDYVPLEEHAPWKNASCRTTTVAWGGEGLGLMVKGKGLECRVSDSRFWA